MNLWPNERLRNYEGLIEFQNGNNELKLSVDEGEIGNWNWRSNENASAWPR